MALAADSGAFSYDLMTALTQTNVTGALYFQSINPADNDLQEEIWIRKISLKPDGEFGAISSEFTNLQFTGKMEKTASTKRTDIPYMAWITPLSA